MPHGSRAASNAFSTFLRSSLCCANILTMLWNQIVDKHTCMHICTHTILHTNTHTQTLQTVVCFDTEHLITLIKQILIKCFVGFHRKQKHNLAEVHSYNSNKKSTIYRLLWLIVSVNLLTFLLVSCHRRLWSIAALCSTFPGRTMERHSAPGGLSHSETIHLSTTKTCR